MEYFRRALCGGETEPGAAPAERKGAPLRRWLGHSEENGRFRASGDVDLSAAPRQLPLVVAVTAVATVVVAEATWSFAASRPALETLGWLGLLLVVSMVAEAFPLPITGVPLGRTSFASVFIIGTAALYGRAAAAVLACVTQAAIEAARRQAPIRLAYNVSVYALAGAAAGAAASLLGRTPALDSTLLKVLAAALAFYAVDLTLISLVVARSTRERLVPLLGRSIRATAVPFGIIASLSLALVVVWERSPLLAIALFGALIAVDLYQRSQLRALESMRGSVSDPITGLGTRRQFEERLGELLDSARAEVAPLTVCLVDVGGLRPFNERYGRPAGDRLLASVGARLALPGEAFRFSGDQFGLLLERLDAPETRAIVDTVLDEIRLTEHHRGTFELVGGLATYPRHAVEPDELLDGASKALESAKAVTGVAVAVYHPEGFQPADLRRSTNAPEDEAARLLAARSLARAVDARDAGAGRHSDSVALLAERVARRMSIPTDEAELIRLAGSLHDVGKLAIPDELLHKPGPLDPAERQVLERHSAIGSRLLASLGLDQMAQWVLHHHERWEGAGYPDGIAGESIPLPARILSVADAYDAMTSDRVHRARLSGAQALGELERCAGTQFDAGVVTAFVAELGDES